jgi:hypothetical protein
MARRERSIAGLLTRECHALKRGSVSVGANQPESEAFSERLTSGLRVAQMAAESEVGELAIEDHLLVVARLQRLAVD